MSKYPENIDAFSPVTGSTEMTEHAERHTAEESSIVAIETTLGTNPEGDADTVADRLDAQDTLIADNTQAIADIVVPDTANFATKTEVAEADAATLQSAESYTDVEVAKIVVPDVSGFATTTELEEGDEATLTASKTYTDEEVGKIVIPDVSVYATKTEVEEADAETLDAAKSYTDSAIDDIEIPSTDNFATKTEVEEADAATLKAAKDYTDSVQPDLATYATKTYVDDADAGLQGQIDAIETYDDTELAETVDSKFTMGGTWGQLAGRS